ncbi:TPA: lysine-N-methylase [Enterobacter cloacae]|uniref:flagellin lysine-N-methylase n=1 Tax=Enterobacter cloacae TaxID=550 RepID=UPI000BA83BEC|nr:flagellin lysine-N-methylase [Enterobacter cloacae]EJD6656197.1 flagellin lysine-N-methylase [Enterobacter cloacae]EKX4051191.1 flagellin lysine-N-methylase [Enterobacter cloacae]PAN88907.1 lysine-N-methylase [Enterobacter cloacae]HAS1019940.1 lysine-N-methylase [Enterobacter cloacae]HAS1057416.1 lysine-N-methylase [Enterobacter cloacae]
MQIHKTIKPIFVCKFKCVGPECLMSCCRGWTIAIDKKTHQKYVLSSHTEIAAIAKKNLILQRKGKNSYSRVKLNEKGDCPFIDENKLCMVHRDLGEEALSHTCSTYPRSSTRYQDETRHTMTLSCPEVVRRVLFDPDAMLLQEQDELVAGYKTNLIGQRQSVSQTQQVIHLFAWNLIQSPSRNIEENLMALAQFILCLQHVNVDLHNKFAEVENFYEALLDELQSGKSLMDSGHLAKSNAMKYLALSVMGTHVAKDSARDGFILEGHQQIAAYLDVAGISDAAELETKFDAINQQWHKLCEDSCLSEPYVLRNYLLYKLYSSYFPGKNMATMMRQFYRIVLDFFYIKFILSVRSMQGEIDQQVVMKTIASLSEKTMHNNTIDARMDAAIDKINGGDDLSCLLLIG